MESPQRQRGEPTLPPRPEQARDPGFLQELGGGPPHLTAQLRVIGMIATASVWRGGVRAWRVSAQSRLAGIAMVS